MPLLGYAFGLLSLSLLAYMCGCAGRGQRGPPLLVASLVAPLRRPPLLLLRLLPSLLCVYGLLLDLPAALGTLTQISMMVAARLWCLRVDRLEQ